MYITFIIGLRMHAFIYIHVHTGHMHVSLIIGTAVCRYLCYSCIRDLVDSLCRDGTDTPISPIQTKQLETPECCCSKSFRHISVSTNGYIPDSTLKVRKIHRYSDVY